MEENLNSNIQPHVSQDQTIWNKILIYKCCANKIKKLNSLLKIIYNYFVKRATYKIWLVSTI